MSTAKEVVDCSLRTHKSVFQKVWEMTDKINIKDATCMKSNMPS